MNLSKLVHSVLAVILAFGTTTCFAQTSADPVGQAMSVLQKRCATCHSQTQSRGDLDVTTIDKILAGSGSGPVVVPGKPEESPLYLLAAHKDNPRMPPNSPRIAQRELGYLQKWIATMRESDATPTTNMATAPGDRVNPKPQVQSTIPDGLVTPRSLPAKAAITALAVDPNFSLLAVSGLRQVLILSMKTRTWVGALEFPEGEVFDLRFSADGQRLFSAGGRSGLEGAVVAWEVGSFKRVFSISTKGDALLAMDCSSDGKLIAVGGPNRAVQLFQTSDGRQVGEFKKHTDWITSLAFSPDGLLLASGDRFGGMWIWELPTRQEFGSRRVHSAQITSLLWSSDSNMLFSTSKDGLAGLWEMQSNSPLAQWLAHKGGVAAAATAQGKWLSVGQDRQLTVWASPEKIEFQREIDADITQIAVSSKLDALVAGDFFGNLHWIPVDSEAPVECISLPVAPSKYAQKIYRPKAIDRTLANDYTGQASTGQASTGQASGAQEEPSELQRALEAAEASLKQARKTVSSLEESIQSIKEVLAIENAGARRNRAQGKTQSPSDDSNLRPEPK